MSSYIRQLLIVFAVLLHYGKLIITETPAFSQPNNPRNLIIPTNTPAVNRAHMKLSFNHDLCHVLRRSLEPRFPRSSMITRSRTRSSQGYHRTLLFAGKLHEYRRRIALVFRERKKKIWYQWLAARRITRIIWSRSSDMGQQRAFHDRSITDFHARLSSGVGEIVGQVIGDRQLEHTRSQR